MIKKKLKVIDFFCGAGGFSEGFRQAGYEIIYGFDHWKPAVDTFNYNFGLSCETKNILEFKESIEEIENLPNTEIIIGSPPCVSFSSSNKSGKADKSLGLDLTKCFLRVVAIKKHQRNSILKAWYMENVANSIKYISEIYSFSDLGLEDWAIKNDISPEKEALNLKDNTVIINSADYGSYQARKRAISGEIIKENKLVIPHKTNSNKNDDNLPSWKTLGSLINSMPAPNSEFTHQLVLDPVYKSIKINQSEISDHFYDSGLFKSEWNQSKELKINHYCMGKMSFPEDLEKPSRTITATKSGTSREALIYKSEYNRIGNGEFRTPTIREAASIMGFPFTYQFLGSINSKWRLVGNAVCPSVSRALALEVLKQYGVEEPKNIILNKKVVNHVEFINLNDYKEKLFDKQPKRTNNSRFRRHPLKAGNITVTLSNYDIEKNVKPDGKWYTSVQYGTGVGFKIQKINDGFFEEIESIISNQKSGCEFIKIINNGFSEKIGNANELQELYELQKSSAKYTEPTELVDLVQEILDELNIENVEVEQKKLKVFKHKEKVPVKQLFALYAINKISTIANEN